VRSKEAERRQYILRRPDRGNGELASWEAVETILQMGPSREDKSHYRKTACDLSFLLT